MAGGPPTLPGWWPLGPDSTCHLLYQWAAWGCVGKKGLLVLFAQAQATSLKLAYDKTATAPTGSSPVPCLLLRAWAPAHS